MAILKKRPLAAACIVLILSAAWGYFLSLLWSAVLLVAATILFLVFFVISLWRGFSYPRLYLMLLCLGLLLGLGRSMLDRRQGEQLNNLMGSVVTAKFEVEEVSYTNAYSSELIVHLEALNGEEARGKAVLLLSYATPFLRGDLVSGSFVIEPLTYENFYENQQYQYRAKGCSAVLVSESAEGLILSGTVAHPIRDWCESLRLSLVATVSTHVKGEAGALLNAMLLGAREELSDSTRLDFQRAGVSHLLALSGLHIGILALLCDRLFWAFGADKRIRIAATLLLLLLYLMITGGSLSTVRAVLMILMLYLAFFCKETSDPLTSLCLAAALILLWQPYAIFSTSYQMTVLATFGILAFGRAQHMLLSILPKRKGRVGFLLRGVRAVLSSLLVTCCAGLFVLPVQWITFGEMSVITPLSNIILIPLTTPFLVLGLGVLLLFPIKPFALACELLGRLMLFISSVLAKPDVMVSLQYDFVPYILLICFILSALLLLLDLKKHAWLALSPIVLFAVSFTIALLIYQHATAGQITAIYRASGKNEGILLVGNGDAMLCDLSNGSVAQLQSSWTLLKEAGATEIDVLMLTHYHSAQKASFARFCERVTVRALWLPPPQNESDLQIFLALTDTALREEIEVTVYDYDTALTVFGGGTLSVSAPYVQKRSTESAGSLTLSFGESVLHYESAALSEYKRAAGVPEMTVDADLFILGSHGPIPHDTVTSAATGGSTVLIPNEEILRWLAVREDISYIVYPEVYHFLLQ